MLVYVKKIGRDNINSMKVFSVEKTSEPDYVTLWSFSSARFWLAFILMFLVFCTINMQANISIAMVCMVNSTAYTTSVAGNESAVTLGHSSPGCMKKENVQDLGMHGIYLWTPEMQGALMSSTAYGSIITIIFAGYIADTYGPRHVCLCGLALYSIVTLMSPFLADTNYWVFLIARSIMGLAGGCFFPGIAAIIVKWYPKGERSTIAAIYTSGSLIGSSLGAFISAKLCLLSFLGGWPLIFYMSGTLGVTCTLLWYLFVTNKPDENRFVNKREIVYLQESIGSVQEGRKKDRFKDVPWRCMIFSPVTWAIIINRFAFSYAMNLMQMLLPSYFRDVLSLNINDNGLFTALPFLAQLISKNICAISADRLRKSGTIGMTNSTRIIEFVGSVGCSLCFASLIFFVDCTTPYLALTFLILFGVFAGGLVAGAFTASLCIAPDFSGTIESAAGFMALLAMVISPTTAGFIIQTGSKNEWNLIFGLASGITLFAGVIFTIFGSAEIQPWSKFATANMHLPRIHPVLGFNPMKLAEDSEKSSNTDLESI